MSQVRARKFQPPLKKTPITQAVGPGVNDTIDIPAVDCTVSTNTQLPHSQVHTLLSFCEESASQRKCDTEAPAMTLRGKENKSRIKKTYQYKYFKNHKNVSVIKRAKLFAVTTSRNKTPSKHKDKLEEVYDYTLTPVSTQEPVAMKKKGKRSEEQVAVDRLVLSRIALTMAEIRAIRLEYQHTVAARPNRMFQLSQDEQIGDKTFVDVMDIDDLTPCLFNNEREP